MARTTRDLRYLLGDLIQWGEKTERVLDGTSSDAIGGDEKTLLALERAVEIVGEICGRLLTQFPEWSAQVDDDDLRDAYRTRNKLAHGYEDVSAELLYQIARDDVAALTAKARRWLADLDAG